MDDVRALVAPEDFFAELVRGLRGAKVLVTLSALYLGAVKEHELALISEIRSALGDPDRPNLKIRLILDHSRAHRDSEQFLSIFRSLIEQHGSRIEVYLYELPSLRTAFMRLLPAQWREVLGVYHCKFMVFDDVAVLTGANLSDEYFLNRQDRYIVLRQQAAEPGLVSFLNSFADIVASDAHQLTATGVTACSGESGAVGDRLRRLAHEFSPTLGAQVTCLPLIQCTALALRGEEETLRALLAGTLPLPHLPQSLTYVIERMQLVSPYPNFSTALLAASLRGRAPGAVTIVTAAPSSHGFANGTGVRRYIPHLHQAVLRNSLASAAPAVGATGATVAGDVQLGLYARRGWTFHGKGLWVQGTTAAGASLQGCYVGSSNMSVRSHDRDFELGFLFVGSGPSEAMRAFDADYASLTRHLADDTSAGAAPFASARTVVARSSGVLRAWERVLVSVFARVVKSVL